MAKIDIEKLHKSYGAHVAVSGLDLELPDQELVVLLGPSGCGKTTTLNCIAGLETPTSGRILFDGDNVTSLPPHKRNVAMVFQSSMLYPHLTARQNISVSLRHSGLSKDDLAKRVAWASQIVNADKLLDKLPGHLSGGERQRVAMAKAIVRQPAVFLLDEPFAALDAALRSVLRAELVSLQRRLTTTMVMVTHDQIEAMTIGDKVAVMRDGKVEQLGAPSEVYKNPRTLFVAGFVGSPPMNLLPGRLSTEADALYFEAEGFRVPVPKRFASVAGTNGVTYGIRPEHLEVSYEEVPAACPAKVFALEQLGRESILIAVDGCGTKLTTIVAAERTTQIGERIWLRPKAAECALFDTGSEQALAP